jgi:predicted transcriptional regulator YdeE
MDVSIVELPDRWVMGTQTRIQPLGADYGTIWSLGFDPHLNEIQPLATEEGFYGIYFGREETGWVDFVAGMMVPDGAQPPAGCVARPVAGGTYARFDCTMATNGSTRSAIYGQWLPASAYAEDQSRPALEYYPPAAMDPQAPVVILTPVKPKA